MKRLILSCNSVAYFVEITKSNKVEILCANLNRSCNAFNVQIEMHLFVLLQVFLSILKAGSLLQK